jgi:hypothetical protein
MSRELLKSSAGGARALKAQTHVTSCQSAKQICAKLIAQITDDVRWLRRRAEERDRVQKQEDEDLLRQIEKTHRAPTKKRGAKSP